MDISDGRQLHKRIVEVLRGEIRRMTPEARLPSDRALAKRFGVSNVTVRSALMQLAEEGYVRRRQGSGTYALSRRLRQHIGILAGLNLRHPRTSTFFLHTSLGAQDYFQQRDYHDKLYVGSSDPAKANGRIDCREFFEDVDADRLLGLLVISGRAEKRWLDTLRSNDVPVVGIGSQYPYGVMLDSSAIVRSGLRWLKEAGCRRVGVIGWQIREAIENEGSNIDPALLLDDMSPATPGAGSLQFRRLCQARDEKPDGVLFTDDCLFRDALPAIYELGLKIPDTLKVASHATRGSDVYYPEGAILMEVCPGDFVTAAGEMLEGLITETYSGPRRQLIGHTLRLAEGVVGDASSGAWKR